jgi:hypothetical protein
VGWTFLGGIVSASPLYIPQYSRHLNKKGVPAFNRKPFVSKNILVGAVGIVPQVGIENA